MSDANIRTVQTLYGHFGRGDIAAMLDHVTDDVTFGIEGRVEDLGMYGIRHGKAGVTSFFSDLAATQHTDEFEPQKFLAVEDKVLVWGRIAWTMCSNGRAGENSFLHVFTCRDGKCCSWRGHIDTAMLAAVASLPPLTAKRSANG